MRLVAIGLICSLGGSSAWAADRHGDYMVRGVGTSSCGHWVQSHLLTDQGATAFQLDAWVTGFVTAFNAYKSDRKDVAEGIDTDGLLAWIDSYCAAHPLTDLSGATVALVDELQTHQR